jgi:hypothetical protein
MTAVHTFIAAPGQSRQPKVEPLDQWVAEGRKHPAAAFQK